VTFLDTDSFDFLQESTFLIAENIIRTTNEEFKSDVNVAHLDKITQDITD
jgi:hypothetical protein